MTPKISAKFRPGRQIEVGYVKTAIFDQYLAVIIIIIINSLFYAARLIVVDQTDTSIQSTNVYTCTHYKEKNAMLKRELGTWLLCNANGTCMSSIDSCYFW